MAAISDTDSRTAGARADRLEIQIQLIRFDGENHIFFQAVGRPLQKHCHSLGQL